MKITGKKVVELSEHEIITLRRAAHLLSDLAEQMDTFDDEMTMECNRAYDICIDLANNARFEFELDDGNCD